MRVTPDKEGTGAFLWQCMSGCGGGSVIDAVMLVENKPMNAVMQEIKKAYYVGPPGYHYQPMQPSRHNPQRPAPEEMSEFDPGLPEVKYGREHPEPVLDVQHAEEFVVAAHKHLLEHLDIVSFFRRGISEEVIVKYRLGFIENTRLKWRPTSRQGWNIPASWVLPITDAENELKAVKLHFEIRPKNPDGTDCEGKSRWAPFGTEPKYDEKTGVTPNHSYYCLWPHPDALERPRAEIVTDIRWWIDRIPDGPLKQQWEGEVEHQKRAVAYEMCKTLETLKGPDNWVALERAFDALRGEIMGTVCKLEDKASGNNGVEDMIDFSEYVYLNPGELKAMAVASSRLMATSVTGGEGWMPPPSILESLGGMKVITLYDDDPPFLDTKGKVRCPGLEWGRNMAAAVARNGAMESLWFTFGQKEIEDERG